MLFSLGLALPPPDLARTNSFIFFFPKIGPPQPLFLAPTNPFVFSFSLGCPSQPQVLDPTYPFGFSFFFRLALPAPCFRPY